MQRPEWRPAAQTQAVGKSLSKAATGTCPSWEESTLPRLFTPLISVTAEFEGKESTPSGPPWKQHGATIDPMETERAEGERNAQGAGRSYKSTCGRPIFLRVKLVKMPLWQYETLFSFFFFFFSIGTFMMPY